MKHKWRGWRGNKGARNIGPQQPQGQKPAAQYQYQGPTTQPVKTSRSDYGRDRIGKIEALTGMAPEVLLTPDVAQDIATIVALCPYEIAWMGTVKELGGESYLIDNIFIGEQEVSAANVDFLEEGLMSMVEQAIRAGYDVNDLRYWGHSHVSMPVSPSGTDLDQAKKFLETGLEYMLCSIHNKAGQSDFRFYSAKGFVWKDIGHRLHDAAAAAREELWRQEIEKVARHRVYQSQHAHHAHRQYLPLPAEGIYGTGGYYGPPDAESHRGVGFNQEVIEADFSLPSDDELLERDLKALMGEDHGAD